MKSGIKELERWLQRDRQLAGWRFSWNTRKRAFGLCGYAIKAIAIAASAAWIKSLLVRYLTNRSETKGA